MKTLFPFELTNRTGVPSGFNSLFLEKKKAGVTWYSVTVKIFSPTKIEFIVYGMKCNVYGGRGEELYKLPLTVDPSYTKEAIERKALSLAATLIAQEEYTRHKIEVKARAKLMLHFLYKNT
jgi:hypothetical protein